MKGMAKRLITWLACLFADCRWLLATLASELHEVSDPSVDFDQWIDLLMSPYFSKLLKTGHVLATKAL